MQIDAVKNKVRTEGVAESHNFTADMSLGLFNILADKLYTDKPLAVIRELVCNAVDAAGSNFKVHLPTAMQPWFTVEDYGTGLSHEFPTKLYTRVGYSDKNHSNEAIGGFGIGSKAPFAYCDGRNGRPASFTVESRFDDKKRVYVAYRGDDGMPHFDLVDTQDYVGPSGLTVTMPVRTQDFDAFERNAKTLLPLVPKGMPECNIEISPLKYTSEGKWWGIRDVGKYDRSVPRAIVGGVPYRISPPRDAEGISKSTQALLQSPIDVYFDIGEVSVAATREELEYTEETLKAINARCEAIIDTMSQEFKGLYDDCTSEFQARKRYHERVLKSNIPSFIRHRVAEKETWQGMTINSTQMQVKAPREFCIATQKYEFRCYLRIISGADLLRINPPRPNYSTMSYINADRYVLAYVDDARRAYRRLQTKLAEEEVINEHRIGERISVTPMVTVIVLSPEQGQTKDQFRKEVAESMPGIPLLFASDLPAPPTPKRGNTPVKIWEWDGHNSWDETSINPEDGGYYINFYKEEAYLPDGSLVPRDEAARRIFRAAQVGVDMPDKIIGIPASRKNIPLNNDGWVCAWELLKERTLKEAERQDVAKLRKIQYQKNQLHEGVTALVVQIPDRGLPKGHKVYQFADAIREMSKTSLRYLPLWEEVLRYLGLEKSLTKKGTTTDVAAMQRDVLNVYPLLKGVAGPKSEWDRDVLYELIEYINLKDRDLSS